MEIKEETTSLAIQESDRTPDGNILPAARARLVDAIDKHISKNKKVNVSEIAQLLDTNWSTANSLVDEVVARWEQEDKKHLKDYKKRVLGLMKRVLDATDEQGTVTSETVRVLASLIKDLTSLDTPEQDKQDVDRAASVHFNNINLTPAMQEELRKTLGIDVTPKSNG